MSSDNVEKRKIRQARYREKHRDEILVRRRVTDAKYRETHRDEIRERDRQMWKENNEARLESSYKSKAKRKDKVQAYNTTYQRARRQKLKEQIFDLLGRQCVVCGYDTDIRALQIDHVNGGGTRHRKSFPSMTAYYEHILASGTSGEFQTLCANCNQIKRYEQGEFKR
jgi:hypothetical protein